MLHKRLFFKTIFILSQEQHEDFILVQSNQEPGLS